jgi:hypothetical protein
MSIMKTNSHVRGILTPGFKAKTVELCTARSAQVARDLDLTETAVRKWVAQADIDAGKGFDASHEIWLGEHHFHARLVDGRLELTRAGIDHRRRAHRSRRGSRPRRDVARC